MKFLVRFCVLALAAGVITTAASADSVLVSYGTSNGTGGSAPTLPAGTINSATYYVGSSSSYDTPVLTGIAGAYNIGTGNANEPNTWASALSGSSWVSSVSYGEPGAASAVPTTIPQGSYTFGTVFTAAAGDTLNLSLYADDTMSVWIVNSDDTLTELLTSSVGEGNTICDDKPVTCTGTADTLSTILGAPTNGDNYALIFDVDQTNGDSMGLDFAGTVTAPTPEPSSLLLLGTGLIGAVGAFRRRLHV